MKRAIILIVVLSVLGFGCGAWVDVTQRSTARAYREQLITIRHMVEENALQAAKAEQAYLHALWQHDERWLNMLVDHHHTRAVTTALGELATALKWQWQREALQALDKTEDALIEIETADFPTLQNIL